jgi:hypothetical protein
MLFGTGCQIKRSKKLKKGNSPLPQRGQNSNDTNALSRPIASTKHMFVVHRDTILKKKHFRRMLQKFTKLPSQTLQKELKIGTVRMPTELSTDIRMLTMVQLTSAEVVPPRTAFVTLRRMQDNAWRVNKINAFRKPKRIRY